jgi:hypothetical protein
MAAMYPQFPRYCGFQSDAERLVYGVLAHQLPDECIVLFGVRLLVRDGPDEIDAEADFIIVEPECGVLVLEIKGGRDPEGRTHGAMVFPGSAWGTACDREPDRASAADSLCTGTETEGRTSNEAVRLSDPARGDLPGCDTSTAVAGS